MSHELQCNYIVIIVKVDTELAGTDYALNNRRGTRVLFDLFVMFRLAPYGAMEKGSPDHPILNAQLF